ncbi:hypothetical protein R9U21_01515, partial [Escherichia coli]
SAQIREILINESAWEEMTCLFAPSLIKPEKLITHTFDFQHVADAISLFEQDQKHCCKVLLTFSE